MKPHAIARSHVLVRCAVLVRAQLKKNVIAAYTAETYFGGHGHSVLNTKLRNLQECPPLTPAAQLLHHDRPSAAGAGSFAAA